MKTFQAKDVPSEVMEAMVIQSLEIVGSSLYKRVQDIISKYPEWFPWETAYKSIPEEVHKAYWEELYPELHKPLELEGSSLKYSRQPVELKTGNLQEVIDMLQKQDEDERKRQVEERIKNKKIWDKHYSKYNLEFKE